MCEIGGLKPEEPSLSQAGLHICCCVMCVKFIHSKGLNALKSAPFVFSDTSQSFDVNIC